MPSGASRGDAADCVSHGGSWTREDGRSLWSGDGAGVETAKERIARLARTIEADVIPRLVQLHRSASGEPHVPSPRAPSAAEIQDFVSRIVEDAESRVLQAIDEMRRRGLSVEAIYLELLAPAARHLGWLWEEDQVDFSTVTVGLGRLQRLLRELSPAFGGEVGHPNNGRRILLSQHEDEQHSFGLSMVAEFFRHAGWEVLGGVAGSGHDAVAAARRDWLDVVGYSVGSEVRLDWLARRIAALRRASRNHEVLVLVGGPIITLHPDWAARVGADAAAPDGGAAPQLAETMLAGRAQMEHAKPPRR